MVGMSVVDMILKDYPSDSPGVKANLYRILSHGALGGTGKIIILPVDQGFEHGPDRSFAMNPDSYDPVYHCKFAIESGMSAFAAPLGMLEVTSGQFPGQIPTILKANSANSLAPSSAPKDQATIADVDDALRLGCSAIGFTIYPGSSACLDMLEEVSFMAREAKSKGLAVVVWAYPRGEELKKSGETALDVTAYSAQIASLLGAHIIKVKFPDSTIEIKENKKVYEEHSIITGNDGKDRIRHIMKAAFDGRRIVVFSGGSKKSEESIFDEARAIREGGGHGSIIGRNVFQRPWNEAMEVIRNLIKIYSLPEC